MMHKADQLLDAVARHYPRAAIIRELAIRTPNHHLWDAWEQGERGGVKPSMTRRIDGLMFAGPQRTALEVKISLADLARDSYRKAGPWIDVTHRFVYVTPAGLTERVPVSVAGLWWVHPDGRIEIRRKAQNRPHPEPLPQHVWTAIAYRAAGVPLIETGDQT